MSSRYAEPNATSPPTQSQLTAESLVTNFAVDGTFNQTGMQQVAVAVLACEVRRFASIVRSMACYCQPLCRTAAWLVFNVAGVGIYSNTGMQQVAVAVLACEVRSCVIGQMACCCRPLCRTMAWLVTNVAGDRIYTSTGMQQVAVAVPACEVRRLPALSGKWHATVNLSVALRLGW